MKYGIRTEIETINTSKYSTYNYVFKYNGQEFPALRDLPGKCVTLRNGNKGFAMQSSSKNGLVVFVGQERLNVAYGKRLTAYHINGKGNPTIHKEECDIMTVSDADGNLFWERKAPVQKPEPFKMTEKEAIRLLKELYSVDIEITGKGKYGRHATKLSDELERERELRFKQKTA